MIREMKRRGAFLMRKKNHHNMMINQMRVTKRWSTEFEVKEEKIKATQMRYTSVTGKTH